MFDPDTLFWTELEEKFDGIEENNLGMEIIVGGAVGAKGKFATCCCGMCAG